ncbi:MAG TPA: HlyD family efflux transporter periplasmic adaptor subunit [Thermoanaerobaculia bacterium]|jgi:RND family efflux transporter MFP subunit|nr:HlyD family efflux transporter periplasmic adaptor subunit [Thermoanaerobaculia bacterium]
MKTTTESRKRLAYRLGLGVVAIAALIALGAFLPLSRPPGGDVPTLKIEAGDFVRDVPAQGELKSMRATPVSVPTSVTGAARIGWLAPDGSLVKQGAVVIRFDPSALEKKLIDAEDDLRGAQLQMEKEQLSGLSEVRKLQQDAAIARVELEQASQFQKKDTDIYSRSEIIESDIDQRLAGERQKHAETSQQSHERLTGTEVALLRIKVRQADAKIQQAQAGLKALAVTAPHDGVLILKRNWRGDTTRVGDSVWNGQPLAEIPDLSAMEAEVYVLEADAGGLKVGKNATVAVESAPGVSYPAHIQRVDALAKPRIPGSPVQYFAVTLALGKTDPKVMKPGQRVQAILQLDQRKDALLVPRQAVFDREGRSIVYRQGKRGFEPVEVKLGASTMGRIVVESGIAAGDVLALRDPTRPAGEPEIKAAPRPSAPPARSGGSGGIMITVG